MQDNLINSQPVDKVIHSLFGTYEKFIISLIQRRQELEKQRSHLSKNLKENEHSLIKQVLSSFHGMKVGKQFYDGQSESLKNSKPENLSSFSSKTDPMEAIGKWLSFNKEDYNKAAGKEIINDETLHSKSSLNNKVSYQPTPLKIYQNETLSYLRAFYFPSLPIATVEKNMILHDFDKKTVRAFKKDISSEDFAHTIAQGVGLQNVNKSKNIKM